MLHTTARYCVIVARPEEKHVISYRVCHTLPLFNLLIAQLCGTQAVSLYSMQYAS
jgi:hypothetical protein